MAWFKTRGNFCYFSNCCEINCLFQKWSEVTHKQSSQLSLNTSYTLYLPWYVLVIGITMFIYNIQFDCILLLECPWLWAWGFIGPLWTRSWQSNVFNFFSAEDWQDRRYLTFGDLEHMFDSPAAAELNLKECFQIISDLIVFFFFLKPFKEEMKL